MVDFDATSLQMDASIDVCFEKQGPCVFSAIILQDALFPKGFCRHGTGFALPGITCLNPLIFMTCTYAKLQK